MSKHERLSQTDALVEKLRLFFQSGAIRAGSKLPTEKELCETYHVGRSTLREAIRTLQVMGYVKIKPGSGTYLLAKTLDNFDASVVRWLAEHQPDVEEVVAARIAIETLAVRLACEKGSPGQLAAIDRARLAYEEALERRDFPSLRALDEEFHKAVIDASGNRLLAIMGGILAVAYRNWRDRSLRIKKHAANAILFHQRIAALILAHDAELAQIQMRRHLEQVLIDMSEVLTVAGENT